MTGHDENVDWARVSFLRGTGLTAADALEKARSERVEQGDRSDGPPDSDAASAAESKLTDAEHKAFHRRTCSPSDSARWVACSLGTKPQLSDAPSPASWNLYCWASASHTNRSDFVRLIWGKLVPSQSELANEARFSDDGHELIEMIERMIAEGRPSRIDNGTTRNREPSHGR